jgi:hypothetical protein
MSSELERIVIKTMNSAAFAEELARQVSNVAEAKILDEFYNEVNRELDKRVKEIVDYYVTHYKQEDIQRQVDVAIRSISKKELLEKL